MKNEQLDITDREIISELRKNCRGSYRDIARRVGLSPAVVIDRMNRLEKKGVIKGIPQALIFLSWGMNLWGLFVSQ